MTYKVYGKGYCACKCSCLLYCSILGGRIYKAPFSYQVPQAHVQTYTVPPVKTQSQFK